MKLEAAGKRLASMSMRTRRRPWSPRWRGGEGEGGGGEGEGGGGEGGGGVGEGGVACGGEGEGGEGEGGGSEAIPPKTSACHVSRSKMRGNAGRLK